MHASVPQGWLSRRIGSTPWVLATTLGFGCSLAESDPVEPERPATVEASKPTPPQERGMADTPPQGTAKSPEDEPSRAKAAIELTFVGDVIFGRYRKTHFDPIPQGDYSVFADVAALLRADMTIGNLETPVVRELPKKSPIGARYKFGASAEHAGHLVDGGFTAVSLANNHAFDLRVEGMQQTPVILSELGIKPLGAARTEPPAIRVETLAHEGWRVGFVAFTTRRNAPAREGTPLLPFVKLREAVPLLEPLVRGAADDHDVVVVVVHWGEEYADAPSRMQTRVAHRLIDAGASLVIGHHPHVLQGIERYGAGVVAYSLGNFLFENVQEVPRLTGVLRVRLAPGQACVERVTLHPAFVKRLPVPHPAPARKLIAHNVRRRVITLSKPFRMRWDVEGEDLVSVDPRCGATSPTPQ